MMTWKAYDFKGRELSHFLIFKTLLPEGDLQGLFTLLWRWQCSVCAHSWCGAGHGGGTAMTPGTTGHPNEASFKGAEWGGRGELCFGHSRLALPSWLMSPGPGAFRAADSLRSICRGKGKPGRGCWIKSCLVPAGDTLGDLGSHAFPSF